MPDTDIPDEGSSTLPRPVIPPATLPRLPRTSTPVATPVTTARRLTDIAQLQRVDIARSAQELHEAAFGHRAEMDRARLSIADQDLLLRQAQALQKAVTERAKLKTEYRRTVTSAAAIDALGDLAPADPEFRKKLSAIGAKYADGINSSPFAQKMWDEKLEERKQFDSGRHEQTLAAFTDPDVAASYEIGITSTGGDTKFAAQMAKATEALKTKAKSLAVDPDVPADVRLKIYSASDGKFNLDDTLLTKAEMAAAAAKAQRAAENTAADSANAKTKQIDSLTRARKALSDISFSRSAGDPDTKAASDAIDDALVRHSKNFGTARSEPSKRAEGGTPAGDELRRLLGTPYAAAPTQPAAASSPVPPSGPDDPAEDGEE